MTSGTAGVVLVPIAAVDIEVGQIQRVEELLAIVAGMPSSRSDSRWNVHQRREKTLLLRRSQEKAEGQIEAFAEAVLGVAEQNGFDALVAIELVARYETAVERNAAAPHDFHYWHGSVKARQAVSTSKTSPPRDPAADETRTIQSRANRLCRGVFFVVD